MHVKCIIFHANENIVPGDSEMESQCSYAYSMVYFQCISCSVKTTISLNFANPFCFNKIANLYCFFLEYLDVIQMFRETSRK